MNNKELLATIRRLRQDNQYLRLECNKQSGKACERLEYLNNKFSWFVDLLAEQQKPSLPWLIKDMKDFLVRTK